MECEAAPMRPVFIHFGYNRTQVLEFSTVSERFRTRIQRNFQVVLDFKSVVKITRIFSEGKEAKALLKSRLEMYERSIAMGSTLEEKQRIRTSAEVSFCRDFCLSFKEMAAAITFDGVSETVFIERADICKDVFGWHIPKVSLSGIL